MKKKINNLNIKTATINDKNPFEIIHAESTSDSISVFFNESQCVTVRHITGTCYEFEFLEDITEDYNEKDIKKKNMKDQEEIKRFSHTMLSFSFSLYWFVTMFFYTIFKIFNVKQYILSISTSLACLIWIIAMLSVEILVRNSFISLDAKTLSNHAAEHKIVNFIKKHHKLPDSLKEFEYSSRVSRYCGTCKYIDTDYINFSSSILVFYIIDNFIVFLVESFKDSITLFSFILLVFILKYLEYIVCYKLCYKLRFKIVYKTLMILVSIIIQLTNTTTRKVSKESLVSAYIAGSIWMSIVHPDNFNLDKYHNLLNSIGVSNVHEVTDQL